MTINAGLYALISCLAVLLAICEVGFIVYYSNTSIIYDLNSIVSESYFQYTSLPKYIIGYYHIIT